MRLESGGIDIFYIDESYDGQVHVVTAVTVPFLRQVEGVWTIVWPNHFAAAKQWRKDIRAAVAIPARKELQGTKLASGRGNYLHGKWQMPRHRARDAYRDILARVQFLPDASIISAAAIGTSGLYGQTRLQAALHALFQRMRRQCVARKVNAIVFFDEGRPDFRSYYRRAQVYLETGSTLGGWKGGLATKNLPLDMFTKDGNEKSSKHCQFTQVADLVAYAAFLKVKAECGSLEDWQNDLGLGLVYDALPRNVLNVRASFANPRDAIVRLGRPKEAPPGLKARRCSSSYSPGSMAGFVNRARSVARCRVDSRGSDAVRGPLADHI